MIMQMLEWDTYDTFKVITMDYWDNEAEVYIDIRIQNLHLRGIKGQRLIFLKQHVSYVNSDAFDDDRIDIE